MRKVIAGLFISIDGVVEAPHLWQFDVFDDDMGAIMTTYLATVDTILLGRVTYQEWADYWPSAPGDEYANHINPTPKVVVSTTLDTVAWGAYDNVTLVRDNLAGTLAEMKRQPGQCISVAGSPTLVRSLLAADLLDELTLMVHPVVVGSGKRLFPEGYALKRLTLTQATTTGSGVAILTYQPRRV
ncbi:MAG: dihydrofolate reductase family protein [Chloroflexi bacterium]|nr:dihydrofolate reductase family protein [Chloroflexota bacterium]